MGGGHCLSGWLWLPHMLSVLKFAVMLCFALSFVTLGGVREMGTPWGWYGEEERT